MKKLEDDLEWTKKAQKLLGQLMGPLRETFQAWKRFRGSNGDIDFFRDSDSTPRIAHNRGGLPIAAIDETFASLERYHEKLLHSNEECDKLAKEVRR